MRAVTLADAVGCSPCGSSPERGPKWWGGLAKSVGSCSCTVGSDKAKLRPSRKRKLEALIPATRPSSENKGPPEFPGLSGASVWMKVCAPGRVMAKRGHNPPGKRRSNRVQNILGWYVSGDQIVDGVAESQHVGDDIEGGRIAKTCGSELATTDAHHRQVDGGVTAQHLALIEIRVIHRNPYRSGPVHNMLIGSDSHGLCSSRS